MIAGPRHSRDERQKFHFRLAQPDCEIRLTRRDTDKRKIDTKERKHHHRHRE